MGPMGPRAGVGVVESVRQSVGPSVRPSRTRKRGPALYIQSDYHIISTPHIQTRSTLGHSLPPSSLSIPPAHYPSLSLSTPFSPPHMAMRGSERLALPGP